MALTSMVSPLEGVLSHHDALGFAQRTVSTVLYRRCRSASPPVKRMARVCGSAADGCLTNEGSSSCAEPFSDSKYSLSWKPQEHVHKQVPSMKRITSTYMTRQPKALKSCMASAKARAQLLRQHSRSLSISCVFDNLGLKMPMDDLGLNQNTNEPYLCGTIKVERKVRKLSICHPRSVSLPSGLFAEIQSENTDADVMSKSNKKRKPSEDLALQDAADFVHLPDDCILKIMSYLNIVQKGKCMLVCKDWCLLVRSPTVWQSVDFREFGLCQAHGAVVPGEFSQCNQKCYAGYIRRIDKFISFLIDVQPRVGSLSFAFDLIADNWLATVERLIMYLNLKDLRHAEINWRDTPVKPYWLERCEPQLNDLLYKSRRRTRKFMDFFELFVTQAPNITSLIVPFDWSTRSVGSLLHLRKLEKLTVQKYFVFQKLSQESLNAVSKLRCLQKLVLEVWMPSCSDLNKYSLRSSSLRYLDISQCRGFYLAHVDLPQLEVFQTERKPWNGPLTFQSQVNLPCVREVLAESGARLRRINECIINGDLSSELVSGLMRKICPCKHHRAGLTM